MPESDFSHYEEGHSSFESIVADYSLAAGLGQISESSVEKLRKFVDMLLAWNKSINLAGAKNAREALEKLVVDSFHLARFLGGLPFPPFPEIWEPGAGAGIPGIPLRILWDKGKYFLLESRRKRAIFMENAIALLNLGNTGVYNGRAEAFFEEKARHGDLADAMVSRAFMPWPKLPSFCGSYLKDQGFLVIMTPDKPGELPAGWRMADSLAYEARGRQYWLWALCADAGK